VAAALAPPARPVLAAAFAHLDTLRRQLQADRTVARRAEHRGAGGPVTLHHGGARQRETVVGAGGEDRPARRHGGDEAGAGRGQAAVVRHDQQVGAQLRPAFTQQALLDLRAYVPG
jgi:hypothetical protein